MGVGEHSAMAERSAYILAGSFVQFLIDRRGLTKFRTLYDSGSYETAYQKSFDALEKEWRSSLPAAQRGRGPRGRSTSQRQSPKKLRDFWPVSRMSSRDGIAWTANKRLQPTGRR